MPHIVLFDKHGNGTGNERLRSLRDARRFVDAIGRVGARVRLVSVGRRRWKLAAAKR